MNDDDKRNWIYKAMLDLVKESWTDLDDLVWAAYHVAYPDHGYTNVDYVKWFAIRNSLGGA